MGQGDIAYIGEESFITGQLYPSDREDDEDYEYRSVDLLDQDGKFVKTVYFHEIDQIKSIGWE